MDQTKPRPRSPGDTRRLQAGLRRRQTITSATNRSLAERLSEGRLQQTQFTATIARLDNFLTAEGINLMYKIKIVNKDKK
jgi:hypothetical protein